MSTLPGAWAYVSRVSWRPLGSLLAFRELACMDDRIFIGPHQSLHRDGSIVSTLPLRPGARDLIIRSRP
jgi:hypothetical protein